MNVINPFSSPRKVKTDPSTAAKSPALMRVLVFGYLAIFCSLHVASFFEVGWRVANHGRLSWLHIFSCVVPALAAASIGLYALGVRPKRYIRCWQSVPYLVFMYALMASRLAYDEFGLVSAGFITTAVLALILYGPAVYMSHRAASSQNDWDIQLQRSQPPANREQLTKKLLVFVGMSGLVVVLMVVFGVAWILIEKPTLNVRLRCPESVVVGEQFDLLLENRNLHSEAIRLDSIDVDVGFLSGFDVVLITPASEEPIDLFGQRSWNFGESVSPGETRIVRFTLKAVKQGHYVGNIDVCNANQDFTTVIPNIDVVAE